MASNCSNHDADINTAEIEPMSDSNTDKEDFVVKVIPIEPFNYNTKNHYAELANFADDNEDDNSIWDPRHVTIPKPFMITTTRTDAQKKMATKDNLLDGNTMN